MKLIKSFILFRIECVRDVTKNDHLSNLFIRGMIDEKLMVYYENMFSFLIFHIKVFKKKKHKTITTRSSRLIQDWRFLVISPLQNKIKLVRAATIFLKSMSIIYFYTP